MRFWLWKSYASFCKSYLVLEARIGPVRLDAMYLVLLDWLTLKNLSTNIINLTSKSRKTLRTIPYPSASAQLAHPFWAMSHLREEKRREIFQQRDSFSIHAQFLQRGLADPKKIIQSKGRMWSRIWLRFSKSVWLNLPWKSSNCVVE